MTMATTMTITMTIRRTVSPFPRPQTSGSVKISWNYGINYYLGPRRTFPTWIWQTHGFLMEGSQVSCCYKGENRKKKNCLVKNHKKTIWKSLNRRKKMRGIRKKWFRAAAKIAKGKKMTFFAKKYVLPPHFECLTLISCHKKYLKKPKSTLKMRGIREKKSLSSCENCIGKKNDVFC